MAGPARVTGPLLDVLKVLLEAFDKRQELHGWVIAKSTQRSGPTVYGVLERLLDMGWIEGRWEEQPAESNRPRRRYYKLTPTGEQAARSLVVARRQERRRPHPRAQFASTWQEWVRVLRVAGSTR